MKNAKISLPLINLAFASLASGIVFTHLLSVSDGLNKSSKEWAKSDHKKKSPAN